MILLPSRAATTVGLLLAVVWIPGCAPAPKWDAQAEAEPFLKAMTFADQKSIKLIRFGAWADRGSTLIFTTDKVDFDDPSVVNLEQDLFPSEDLIGSIEKISEHRFAKPAAKYSVITGDLPGNKRAKVSVLVDGDRYVCKVYVVKPKLQESSATSKATPTTARTPGTMKLGAGK